MNLYEKYKELPDTWVEHVSNLSESGMGYQKVEVVFSHGSVEGLVFNNTYLDVDEDIDVREIEDIKMRE